MTPGGDMAPKDFDALVRESEIDELVRRACLAVGNLGGAHERLRAVLMEGESWPLRDVITKLVEASEILLHQKNYDGHGWEQISHAVDRAKVALANWPKQP